MGTYVAIVVAATMSAVSSAALLACFLLFPKWRNKPSGTKHILLVLTIYDLLAGANYFINPSRMPNLCQVQATVMQWFEIGGWLWTAVLPVELARALYVSVKWLKRDHTTGVCIFKGYIVNYHAFVHTYCAVTVGLMHGLGISGQAGDWCWATSDVFVVATYCALWCSFAVIGLASCFILHLIAEAESGLKERESLGTIDYRDVVRRRRNFRARRKLLLIPLAFMVLHIPGTLRRCANLAQCASCDNEWIQLLQAICDPSQGTVNCLLFGLMDLQLQAEIRAALAQTTWPQTSLGRWCARCCAMVCATRTTLLGTEEELDEPDEEPDWDGSHESVASSRSTALDYSLNRDRDTATSVRITELADFSLTKAPSEAATTQPQMGFKPALDQRNKRTVSVVSEGGEADPRESGLRTVTDLANAKELAEV